MASRKTRTHTARWEGSKAVMQRLARKNPIDELRKPWKVAPGEQRTFDASWNLCLHHAHDVPTVIEVLTAGEGEPVEVVVFLVETRRFTELKPDASLEATFARDPAKPWEASAAYIEWVKENATRVFRGQADERETFCIRHSPARSADTTETCTHNCTLTDDVHSGWRGLLWSFLNQERYSFNMSWRTPVVIDRDYVTDLNHASLPTPELRDLHKQLVGYALSTKDYYENNGDCVDEVAREFLNDITDAVLDNDYLACVNEDGTQRQPMSNGPGIAVAAESKWREHVTERLVHIEWEGPFYARKFDQMSGEAKIQEDFEQWLRSEVKHNTQMFNREEWNALTEEPPDADGKRVIMLNDKWLRVCTWEQSSVEDQLNEDVVEALNTLDAGPHEDVEAALRRQDIDLTGEESLTVDCDCYWVFAIDVNDAIEKLNDLIAEWKIPDEDLDDSDAREDDES